ncbi:hypothetical protein ABIB07_004539 [Bradyrhizobium sp. RT10b]
MPERYDGGVAGPKLKTAYVGPIDTQAIGQFCL